MKKNMILSISSLILSVILFVGVAFAWLIASSGYTNVYFAYSGAVNVTAEAYMGLDEDFDGILDNPSNTTSRADVLNNRYVTLAEALRENKNPLTNEESFFSNIYPGKVLTYKFVVINDGEKDVSLDLSFGEMQSYFYEALNTYLAMDTPSLASSAMVNLYSENSARLMFNIANVKCTQYQKDVGTNNMTTGYSLVKSVANYDGEERYLWQYGDGREILGQNVSNLDTYDRSNLVVINPNSLMEIDFVIVCVQNSSSIASYISTATDYTDLGLYYQKYVLKYPNALSAYGENNIKQAISDIAVTERSFIFSNSDDNPSFSGKMEFTIPSIKLRGTVLPGVR